MNQEKQSNQGGVSLWGSVLSIFGLILSCFCYLILIVRWGTGDVWTYYDRFHSFYPYFSQEAYIFFQKITDPAVFTLLLIPSVLSLVLARIIFKKGKIFLIFMIIDIIFLVYYGLSYLYVRFIF